MRREEHPPAHGPQLGVIRCRKKLRDIIVWVIGTRVHGYVCHWNGLVTVPCYREKDEDHCDGCKRQWPERWRGYVDCFMEHQKERGFLELTSLARDQLLETVNGELNLRGSRLRVTRGNGDKTRMKFTYLAPPAAQHLHHLPKEIDPHDTVKELWEMEGKSDGKVRCNTPPPSDGLFAAEEE